MKVYNRLNLQKGLIENELKMLNELPDPLDPRGGYKKYLY